MDDVREINKELDRLDSKLKRIEEERKDIYAKRDQKKASKETVGLDLLRNEKSKKKTEKEWRNAIRQLAQTTEEGKDLARQCEEKENKENILKQERKELNLAWNTAVGDEEKRIGEEREAVITQIKKLEQEKKAMLEELTEMGKALREQYKAETLVIEEEEIPDSGDSEYSEEKPIETHDENESIIDKKLNSAISKETDEQVVETKQSSEEIFAKIEEEVKREQATRYGLSEKVQKGVDIIARIRNLRAECEDICKNAFEKMPESTLGEGVIADLEKLEEIVAEKFGLNQEEEQEEEPTVTANQDAMNVILQQIDNIKADLESTTGDELKEKMLEKFGNLRDAVPQTIPEQNKTEIIDFIENAMNYVDVDFLFKSEGELKDWIMQDLEMLKECLSEKFGVISQEQEEASEEQQPEVGAPKPTKETVTTEWKQGVQQPGNFEEEKKGENMNQNSKPENALVSTGVANSTDEKSAEERKEKMIQLTEEVNAFTNSVNRRKNEIDALKAKRDSFPEGSVERKEIEKDITLREGEMRVLKTQAERARQKYDGLVDQESVKKEEAEKKTNTPEPIIHIKGIEGTENERVLLDLLKRSALIAVYKAQFKQGSSIPAMSLDEIGSLMKKTKDILKGRKNQTKRRTPERERERDYIKTFNFYKKQIKEQVKAIEKERDFIDDYEME